MKKIILIISSFLTLLLIYSCQDTLGVNNTEYLKNSMIDTLSHDTLIVDYKKIIITYYIVEHDTLFKYDTIPITRNPVFASQFNFSIMEKFIDRKGLESDYLLPSINPLKRTAFINYNNYLPALNIDFSLENKDSNSFKQNPFRTELFSKISLKLNNIDIISDSPKFLNDLYNNQKCDINLKFNKITNENFELGLNEIYGYLYFYKRNVVNGQLASITMELVVFTPSLYNTITGDYALDMIVNFVFPIF